MTTVDEKQVFPNFVDLPVLPETEEHHSWGIWGSEDEIGTINFIGADQIRHASALVHDGTVVPLSLPLNEPSPYLGNSRSLYVQTIKKGSHGRDDKLDNFYPQFSSQWDGLRHVRYRQHGFYGGRQDDDIDERGKLGIDHWARRGIIGRGVLLDAKRYFDSLGQPFAANENRPITAEDLDQIAAFEGVSITQGDIVMVRTGWVEWFQSLDIDARSAMQGTVGATEHPFACPGLDPHRETAAWLWDHKVAAVASDNMALESLPVSREVGFLHYRLIPMLGMAIGEFWGLGEVSEHCAKIQRYEFFFTSGVLNLPGGVGSPTNAYAIF